MTTDQQSRIESALFSLIEVAGKYLTVNLYTKPEAAQYCRHPEHPLKTKAIFSDMRNSVILHLIEPDNGEELEYWADAIIDAEMKLGQLDKERLHFESHPNFFISLRNKINNRYQR